MDNPLKYLLVAPGKHRETQFYIDTDGKACRRRPGRPNLDDIDMSDMTAKECDAMGTWQAFKDMTPTNFVGHVVGLVVDGHIYMAYVLGLRIHANLTENKLVKLSSLANSMGGVMDVLGHGSEQSFTISHHRAAMGIGEIISLRETADGIYDLHQVTAHTPKGWICHCLRGNVTSRLVVPAHKVTLHPCWGQPYIDWAFHVFVQALDEDQLQIIRTDILNGLKAEGLDKDVYQ